MSDHISVPTDWVRTVSRLALPDATQHRLQVLMDRNNEGELNASERAALETIVDIDHSLSLVRATALKLLGEIA